MQRKSDLCRLGPVSLLEIIPKPVCCDAEHVPNTFNTQILLFRAKPFFKSEKEQLLTSPRETHTKGEASCTCDQVQRLTEKLHEMSDHTDFEPQNTWLSGSIETTCTSTRVNRRAQLHLWLCGPVSLTLCCMSQMSIRGTKSERPPLHRDSWICLCKVLHDTTVLYVLNEKKREHTLPLIYSYSYCLYNTLDKLNLAFSFLHIRNHHHQTSW